MRRNESPRPRQQDRADLNYKIDNIKNYCKRASDSMSLEGSQLKEIAF